MSLLLRDPFFKSVFDSTTAPARTWRPPIDLYEREDDFVLEADLPGLTAADIDLEVQDRLLTISGERKFDREAKGDGWRHVERMSGKFSRTLRLPAGVDGTGVTADFADGVLTVTVPKPEERKPHRIEIGAGQPAVEGSVGE